MINIKTKLKKFRILYNLTLGYFYKFLIDLKIIRIKKNNQKNLNNKIIVSLTSYGRRVANNVVYYTLFSLINQSIKPYKIILWLDKDNWNDKNIPSKLLKLKKYGIEIRFCEDYKSYKKLLPTLKEFPDNIIITVDDDIIYKSNLLETLMEGHLKNPNKIISMHSRYPLTDKSGKHFRSYSFWEAPYNYIQYSSFLMPIGAGGILYPPNSLNKQVTNYKIAKDLSPLADDLWFWIMAKLNKTNHIVVNQTKSIGYSFDILYQFLHKGSALTHSNREQNKNDEQLKNLIKYYKLEITDLENKFD